MNDTVKLYGANGEALGSSPMKVASREEIAMNIFNHYMHSDEQQLFLSALSQYAPVDENGRLSISLSDENIVRCTITYASSKIINEALDENLSEAYKLLLTCSDPSRFNDASRVELTEGMLNEIRNRHMFVPELAIAQDICDVQGEIYSVLHGMSDKQVTSYQANKIQEKFEDFTQYLSPEQIAAGYYNMSIIHRALLGEKDIYDPKENNAEKECLYKVIENTSDYKRIRYCLNRLGPDYVNKGAVRAAYRRALKEATLPGDLYKINISLAECYENEYKPVIGYAGKEEHQEPLLKAELHYSEALRYSQVSEKPALLKKIAKIQLTQGRLEDWTETETYLAMKILNGEERVHTLLNVAAKNKKLRKDYLEFALGQTVKSRKIVKRKKKLIVSKIDHNLRPIYESEGNKEAIKQLDTVVSQFKDVAYSENPLEKYMKNKKGIQI